MILILNHFDQNLRKYNARIANFSVLIQNAYLWSTFAMVTMTVAMVVTRIIAQPQTLPAKPMSSG